MNRLSFIFEIGCSLKGGEKVKKIQRGFTLIELLVVIAILGVLAAGVVVAINPAKRIKQANDSKIKNDVGQIATAAQAFYTGSATQSYPTVLADIGPTGTGDLKVIPIPPSCSTSTAYQLVTSTTSCTPATAICNAAVYALICDSTTSEVWCWQSSTGVAKQLAGAANCTAP